MARIEWQQSYATGIESIDTQHQQIIELINRLDVSVAKQDRQEVSEILSGLREYIHTHFSYEEHLLEQSGYKFTESHIRGHRRFVERLESLTQRFEAGAYVSRELLNFLHRWLVNHIAHEDQNYVSSVNANLGPDDVVQSHS